MNSTHPCMRVNDIETTIKWYEDFLGYQCTYKSAIKSPESALIEKDNQKIYLFEDERREAYASNIVVVESSDIESEYKKLNNTGVIIVQDIIKGMFSEKEFVIKDYEDNKIVYVQKT